MSKLLASAFLALTLVMTIASTCGGGGGSSNAQTVTGSIDSGILSKANAESGEYEIWAEYNGSTVKMGKIMAGEAGEDSTYSIAGLLDGETYVVTLYRKAGLVDKVPVLSSVVTASASTGSLAKARLKHLRRGRQMNSVTSFLARQFSAFRVLNRTVAQAKSEALTEAFGSSSTLNIENINVDGGVITSGTGIGVSLQPLARAVVSQLTIASVATVSLSGSDVVTQATTISTFIKTVSVATSYEAVLTAVSTSLTTVVSVVTSSSSTSFTSAMVSADSALAGSSLVSSLTATTYVAPTVTSFVSTNIAVELAVAAIASSTGVTVTVDLTTILTQISSLVTTVTIDSAALATIQTEASTTFETVVTQVTTTTTIVISTTTVTSISDAIESGEDVAIDDSGTVTTTTLTVSTFALAHSTYGSKATGTNDFTLNTLAPVFKVVLSKAVATASDEVSLSIVKNGTTTITLSNVGNSVMDVAGSDLKTHYLAVMWTSTGTAPQLEPGSTYDYTITVNSGATVTLDGTASATVTGTITTLPVTVTFPYGSSSDDSQVNLSAGSLLGVNTLTPTFYVHAASTVSPANASSLVGLFTFSIGSNEITDMVNHVDVTAETTSFSAMVNSGLLTSGSGYTMTMSSATGVTLNGSNLTSSDFPASVSMDMQ